ncbi:minor capsid protein [Martelella sp. AMO21009]
MAMRYEEPAIRNSRAYRLAFEQYLRYGTAIRLEGKAEEHSTTHYIWRTQEDDRVRPSHRANNGNIYAFNNPPATGNPGEAYGCRCWAEPYDVSAGEYFDTELSGISDAANQWRWWQFINWYFRGNGEPLAVRETGYLSEIVNRFRQEAIDDPKRLPGQIADAARSAREGNFSYEFDGNYEMQQIVFSVGTTTIRGRVNGSCRKEADMLELRGAIAFELADVFRDPYDAGSYYELLNEAATIIVDAIAGGLHDAAEIAGHVSARLGNGNRTLVTLILEMTESALRDSNRFYQDFLDFMPTEVFLATPYAIIDQWKGNFRGRVSIERSASRYFDKRR